MMPNFWCIIQVFELLNSLWAKPC